ncbi:hypothetical protein GCM10009665_56620 [Kitasatospora nipponensis]|uniref:DUF4190 domain-containing protein n=1 Tax=Kitasatospora nipponensis TaxID=258049 RepID=A0ABN1WSA1_9ACTN
MAASRDTEPPIERTPPPAAGSAWAPPAAQPADPWAAPPTHTASPWSVPGAYQAPYGPPPHGVDGRRFVEGSNGLAVTSLVTGLTCCLWPAALGFGIAALVQLRGRHQRGRGLAVAGVVLGVVGLIAATFGLLTGTLHFHFDTADGTPAPPYRTTAPAVPEVPGTPGTGTGTGTGDRLQPGDCFSEQTAGGGPQIMPTACSGPHYGEVTALVVLPGSRFPGAQQVRTQAAIACNGAESSYILDPWARSSTIESQYSSPDTPAEWTRNGHTVICYLHDTTPGGGTGSLRRDGTNLTQSQRDFLQDVSSLESLRHLLRVPVTDPDMAIQTATDAVRTLNQTEYAFTRSTWPADVRERAAAVVNALQADEAVWSAVAKSYADPLSAFNAALQNHNPTALEAAGRRAFALPDRDLSADSAGAKPTTPPSATARPGAGGTPTAATV